MSGTNTRGLPHGFSAFLLDVWCWAMVCWGFPGGTLLLFSHSVVSNSLKPHRLQHARLPCPSSSPRVCSNSGPLTRWCHPTISSSVVPFSSCLQSFSAPGSFQMSLLFTSGGQSIGALASVLPMNIQDWFALGLTGLISLQSKGLSPGGASGKEPPCQCRRHKGCGFHPWICEIPWKRAWQPTPGFLLRESRG